MPGSIDIIAGSMTVYASMFGNMLIASTASTSMIGLIGIPIGASCISLTGGISGLNLPLKVLKKMIALQVNVKMLATQAITGSIRPIVPPLHISYWATFVSPVKNNSFDRKPLNGGRPAIAASPITESVAEIGMIVIRPPSFLISLVPVSWSMMPATMKRLPLNVAWLIRWKTAARIAVVYNALSPSI